MKTIVLATKNQGKVVEFRQFFQSWEIKTLADLNVDAEIVENGMTFKENALIKAKAIYDLIKQPVIADDSGLEVEYLNGEPGIYSARYSGQGDLANNLKLLERLENVPKEERKARFVCAIAYVAGDKEVVVEGYCHGQIGNALKGTNGFGYDPLFVVDHVNKTFAELTQNEKMQISHRADALRKLKNILGE